MTTPASGRFDDQRAAELGRDRDVHDVGEYDLWLRLFKHHHTNSAIYPRPERSSRRGVTSAATPGTVSLLRTEQRDQAVRERAPPAQAVVATHELLIVDLVPFSARSTSRK